MPSTLQMSVNRSALHGLAFWMVFGQTLLGDEKKPASKPPQVATGRFVYKNEPRRTLTVYYPEDWKATNKRTALVIFRCRIPKQREHFRRIGMVICPDFGGAAT